jgi:hypothetical protein
MDAGDDGGRGRGPAWLSGGEPAVGVVRVPTSEIQSRGQGTGGWYELLGSLAGAADYSFT